MMDVKFLISFEMVSESLFIYAPDFEPYGLERAWVGVLWVCRNGCLDMHSVGVSVRVVW